MPQERYRPEEIIAKLRKAEVLLGEGKKVPEVTKALGAVGRAVPAAMQSMASRVSRRGWDGSHTAEPGEGGFRAQPVAVVAEADEQGCSGLAAHGEGPEGLGVELELALAGCPSPSV